MCCIGISCEVAHYHYTDSSIHWAPYYPFLFVLSFFPIYLLFCFLFVLWNN
ncbi:hypothetical protein MACK_003479 [Theileria orientalis]|uniref:Uncharacterized protein n=1 Tax=Theileria orientalis TaxID=68886 RepID=A0A976SJ87_THEOR|nr:hypothetical protein MACK_003479 [Theileria orientalis]